MERLKKDWLGYSLIGLAVIVAIALVFRTRPLSETYPMSHDHMSYWTGELDSDLVGSWTRNAGGMIFRADGTGETTFALSSNRTFTWSVYGNVIIKNYEGRLPSSFVYEVNGNRLRISERQFGRRDTNTFTRARE